MTTYNLSPLLGGTVNNRRDISIYLTQENCRLEYLLDAAQTLGLTSFFKSGIRAMLVRLRIVPSSLPIEIFAAQCSEAEQAFSLALLNKDVHHISHCDGTGLLVFHIFSHGSKEPFNLTALIAQVSDLLSYSYPHVYVLGDMSVVPEEIYANYARCVSAMDAGETFNHSSQMEQRHMKTAGTMNSVSNPYGNAREKVRKAIAMMEQGLGSAEFTIERLASLEQMTAAHFCRIFREDMGITPLAFLTELRMDHAKSMLASGTMAIRIVALSSGFESGEYFSRVFRRHVGMTPSQYRAEANIHSVSEQHSS